MSQDRLLNPQRDGIYLIVFLAILLAMFGSFFLTNKVFYERDMTLLEIPLRIHTAELLQEGRFALWSDAQGNGQPFLANPKNAVLYPGTWLYAFLPVFTAFKIHYIIHFLLGWLGLFALIRSLGPSRPAAFFSATAFFLSGGVLSSLEFYNHLATLAWMFWILVFIRRTQALTWRTAAGGGSLWALLILSGSPHIFAATVLLSGLMILALEEKRRFKSLLLALPLLAGIALTAVQLIPSLELMAGADRAAINHGEWSFEGVQFLDVIFPGVLGDDRAPGRMEYWAGHLFDRENPLYYSFYLGAGICLLALFGWRRVSGRSQFFLGAGGLIFLILSFGRHLPGWSIAAPVFAWSRYPVKYFLFALLCLTILAAWGFDAAGEGPRRQRVQGLVLPAAALLAAGSWSIIRAPVLSFFSKLFILDMAQQSRLGIAFDRGFVILGASAVLLILSIRKKDSAAWFRWALAGLIIGDLCMANARINPVTTATRFQAHSEMAAHLPEIIHRHYDYSRNQRIAAGSGLEAMSYLRQTAYPMSLIGQHVHYLHNPDFYGLYDRETRDVAMAVEKMIPSQLARFLKNTGCDTYLGLMNLPLPAGPARTLEGTSIVRQTIRSNAAPAAALDRAIVLPDLAERIRVLAGSEFDSSRTALLAEDLDFESAAEEPVRLDLLAHQRSHGYCRLEVALDRRALVAIPGRSSPGWVGWIDGRLVPVRSVNLTSKAVLVEPGRHEIVIAYQPRSFRAGAAASLAALAIILIGVLMAKRARPRTRRS